MLNSLDLMTKYFKKAETADLNLKSTPIPPQTSSMKPIDVIPPKLIVEKLEKPKEMEKLSQEVKS